mmetsp:Transcript_45073/g.141339  ORF Transcript_45073/g.141339 Transcript_45073/m.141339 type:complete len:223 (+) Transcript_45073:466-1134(+)
MVDTSVSMRPPKSSMWAQESLCMGCQRFPAPMQMTCERLSWKGKRLHPGASQPAKSASASRFRICRLRTPSQISSSSGCCNTFQLAGERETTALALRVCRPRNPSPVGAASTYGLISSMRRSHVSRLTARSTTTAPSRKRAARARSGWSEAAQCTRPEGSAAAADRSSLAMCCHFSGRATSAPGRPPLPERRISPAMAGDPLARASGRGRGPTTAWGPGCAA